MDNRKIPAITTDQMRQVDDLMVNVYQIELIQMMENAGRNLARLAMELFLEIELCRQAGSGLGWRWW